jgi:hypothetical protein
MTLKFPAGKRNEFWSAHGRQIEDRNGFAKSVSHGWPFSTRFYFGIGLGHRARAVSLVAVPFDRTRLRRSCRCLEDENPETPARIAVTSAPSEKTIMVSPGFMPTPRHEKPRELESGIRVSPRHRGR